MFCGKCGNPVNNDASFCPNCGAPVSQQPAAEEVYSEVAAEEGVGAAQEYVDDVNASVADENVFAAAQENEVLNLNTEGADATPKKASKLPFLIGGLVVAAAAILLLAFNWSNVCGFFVRTFSTPEKLQAKVYEEIVVDAIDQADAMISDAKATNASSGSEGVLRITLDQALLNLIGGQGMDMSWLSDIAVAYDYSAKDSRYQMSYDALLDDIKLISADHYIDTKAYEQWFSIPELNENAVYMNLMESSGFSKDELAKALEMIPSKEVLSRVAARYVGILMSGFGEIEKSTDNVKLNGLSQRLHKLEATMDEDDLAKVLEDMIKGLKKDNDIESIIRKMEEVTGEQGLYDAMLETMDDALSELDTEDFEIPSFKLKLTTYLNGANEIVGMAIKVSASGVSVEPFSAITVEQGKKFATQIQFGAGEYVFMIEGEGTNGKSTTGDYVLTYQDDELLTVKLKDYVVNNNVPTGEIRIELDESFVEGFVEAFFVEQMYLDESVTGIIAEMDWAFVIQMSGSAKDYQASLSIAGDNTKYITISATAKEKKPSAIKFPEKYIDMDDYDFEEQWSETLNQDFLDTLLNRLREAGVPEELLEMATMEAM